METSRVTRRIRGVAPLIAAIVLGLASGPARADVEDGWHAYLTGNPAKAVAEIRPAAEAGDPQAQFYLGSLYEAGAGVPRDYSRAVNWYTRAAEQGHGSAQLALGLILYNGAGEGSVPQDLEEAARWLMAAARQEDPKPYAQFLVGHMYLEGRGLPRDLKKAEAYARAAAEHGVAGAQYDLGLLIGSREHTLAERIESYAWFLLAARQGHPGAAENLEVLARALNHTEIEQARAAADAFTPVE